MDAERHKVMIANITWNNSGWRTIYVNPKAGHKYSKKHPGHECLNFEFNKRGLDNTENVYGHITWTNAPTKLSENAVIIFYTKNLETCKGEIIGIYGDAKILAEEKTTKWKGFKEGKLYSNIVCKKELSLLFPIPLDSSNYSKGKRLVPQAGFTYKKIELAEKIIVDEIKALQKAGIKLEEYKKLREIYKFITGREYPLTKVENSDLEEQEELLPIVTAEYDKKRIVEELRELTPQNPEFVNFGGKQYKRDNNTIVELKILRDFKCQMCGFTILKKDNSYYIEAAHITEKKQKGPETPDNILILCPNHHKEFDLGNKKIIERTKEKIVFDLNDQRYDIQLTLD